MCAERYFANDTHQSNGRPAVTGKFRFHIYRAGSIPCHAGVHEYQFGASWHRQMKVVVRPRGPVSRSNTVLHAEKKQPTRVQCVWLREPQQAQLRWSTSRIESMVHCTPPDRNVPLQLYFTAAWLQEGFASKPFTQVLLDTSMKHCCLAVPMACTNHQVPRGTRLPGLRHSHTCTQSGITPSSRDPRRCCIWALRLVQRLERVGSGIGHLSFFRSNSWRNS